MAISFRIITSCSCPAVAAIPESLNPIITIVLSLETENYLKKIVIMKELKSIEALDQYQLFVLDKIEH